ncbi:sodium-coupled monocarboxylate transporter 1-like [Penaeus japonicus]|uniref:sodium-coupled monocarboxylate transporter 1-like n=1 Tax=Penaeus japonicus TaxID=27405 RepID=UPI001C7116FC|nr:sodium-coupled monocarboxylate transporter 1-like [Penaeus japonicus]
MSLNTEELVGRFTWADYTVFGLMLGVSAGIGVFYGLCSRTKQDTKEFLMAGKSMTTFPVAMSLIASFMSAITLLGTPAEVYQYGFLYWLIGWSYFLVMPSAAYLYFPVFHKLQVTSAYEYLEIRFNRKIRWMGSFTFILQMCLYMAIVVYAPALALAQVTGMNVYLSVSLISFVCIFYTTLGGMKAVLWTDAIQMIIMFGSTLFIIIKGTIDMGGFEYVWETNKASGRIELVNFDPNPTTRHSIWTLVIGGYFTWIANYGVNQAQVQRYLCVKTKAMVERALWINLAGLFVLMFSCAFGGLVIFARYWDCDPIGAGVVTSADQLMPLFVMDTVGEWKGLPGLFVAGIFAGALSTVSSGMNSLAAIVLEDFLRNGCYIKEPVLGIGLGIATVNSRNTEREKERERERGRERVCVCVCLISRSPYQTPITLSFPSRQPQAALSIFGMVGGPLLGLFSLGMFFPWANSVGAAVGHVTGLVFMFWIGVGTQVGLATGDVTYEKKPLSVSGCNFTQSTTEFSSISTDFLSTSATSSVPTEPPSGTLGLYQLSYMWYSATGCFTVIVVGLTVSLLTGGRDLGSLDPRTLSPPLLWLRRWIPALRAVGENLNDELDELRETSVPEKDAGDLTSVISKIPPSTLSSSSKEVKTDKAPAALDVGALARNDPSKAPDSGFKDDSSRRGILEGEDEPSEEDLGFENSAMSLDEVDRTKTSSPPNSTTDL